MTNEHVDMVALAIYGSLAEGGWGDSCQTWRECVPEVEAAWRELEEWERDDYRRSAREAIAVADAIRSAA